MDIKNMGRLIARRRKEKGLSQVELAKMIYVTDKAVSRWETGRGMPAFESLEPLANALDLTVSELLGENQSEVHEPARESAPNDFWRWWPYYFISALLAFGFSIGMLLLRLHLNLSDILISAKPLLAGAAGGILASGILHYLKKAGILLAISAALPILWFVIPGDSIAASAILGCGYLCGIASIPHLSGLLASVSKRGTRP